MDNDTNMGKLSVSISTEDEKKLRALAKKNCRTISGQITYWIRKEETSKKAN